MYRELGGFNVSDCCNYQHKERKRVMKLLKDELTIGMVCAISMGEETTTFYHCEGEKWIRLLDSKDNCICSCSCREAFKNKIDKRKYIINAVRETIECKLKNQGGHGRDSLHFTYGEVACLVTLLNT